MTTTTPRCGSKAAPWAPRIWYGMTLPAWLSLLQQNRFRVTPSRWPLAVGVSLASVVNSALSGVQSLLLGRRIDAVALRDDPVFVIGHWRSGTTLLHELLALDPQHACADTYACLAPSHFLISRHLVPWWLKFLMPRSRPMDNMRVGWDRPQEDEWAFCLLGLPSLYRLVAFPRRIPQCPAALELRALPPDARQDWERSVTRFLKSVVWRQAAARLVLKSPPHTARIETLLRMFPRARFVHVVRDPLSVFPSTVHLWSRLAADHGLQLPVKSDLEEFVLSTFVQMYAAFESDRQRIPAGHLCEVRYEQLVADPLGQLRQIYQQLSLGDFDTVRPLVERHVAGLSDYQVNRYQLTEAQRQRVLQCWSDFCRQYGYAPDQAILPNSARARLAA